MRQRRCDGRNGLMGITRVSDRSRGSSPDGPAAAVEAPEEDSEAVKAETPEFSWGVQGLSKTIIIVTGNDTIIDCFLQSLRV